MAEPTPTFAGEVQLRRWSESNTQGVQVTFALAESSDLDKFKGLDGKRFMAVFVAIGDDEQPVDVRNSDNKTKVSQPHFAREPLGDLCWRSVQWCKEPEFWVFLGLAYGGAIGSEQSAKHELENLCGISSRKELDTNPEAARKFNQLIRGPYQKHLIARGVVR